MLCIGVDIGGTFTDVIVYEPATARLAEAKTLSTPHDPAAAIFEGLAKLGVSLDTVDRFVHGTTRVTNALLEGSGERCRVLATEGFRDVLEMGLGHRPRLYSVKESGPAAARRAPAPARAARTHRRRRQRRPAAGHRRAGRGPRPGGRRRSPGGGGLPAALLPQSRPRAGRRAAAGGAVPRPGLHRLLRRGAGAGRVRAVRHHRAQRQRAGDRRRLPARTGRRPRRQRVRPPAVDHDEQRRGRLHRGGRAAADQPRPLGARRRGRGHRAPRLASPAIPTSSPATSAAPARTSA